MRRRNFFIAAIVAIITFFSLQAFVRPYGWNRWGYGHRYDRYERFGPADDYDYWHDWRYRHRRSTPVNPADSTQRERW